MSEYIHLQTKVTREEKREIDIYLAQLGIDHKSEWIRKVILKEVRKNVEPEPFFDDSEQEEQSEFFEPEPESDVESISDDGELPTDEAPPKLDLF